MLRPVTLALMLIVLATPAAAQIFRYTDDTGTNHYVEGIESVPQPYRARAVPLGLSNTAPAPPPRAAAPEGASRPAGATIPYTPGERIMVNAILNGSTPARLMLDTGADRTMIDPRVLVSAGVALSRPVGTARVSGVGGTQEMQFVTVASLEVGGASVGNLTVGAHGVEGAGDGLLGRDFLDNFSVNIDSTKGVVTLSPK